MDYEGVDPSYVKTRLAGSVVRVKKTGRLVCVDGLQGSKARCIYLTDEDEITDIPYKELNVNTPPLGYFKYRRNGATEYKYGIRLPVRKYKQGLNSDNFAFLDRESSYGFRTVNPHTVGISLQNLVDGVYPELDSCMEDVFNMELKVCGVSREFALSTKSKGGGVLALLHKDVEVGIWNIKSSSPRLSNNHLYLQDSVNEFLTTTK